MTNNGMTLLVLVPTWNVNNRDGHQQFDQREGAFWISTHVGIMNLFRIPKTSVLGVKSSDHLHTKRFPGAGMKPVGWVASTSGFTVRYRRAGGVSHREGIGDQNDSAFPVSAASTERRPQNAK